MQAFMVLLKRDLALSIRQSGAIVTALGFYIIVIVFLPLGLGPSNDLLSRIAPGMIWIALLLATLLSMERIFANDYEDGSLELIVLGPLALEFVVIAKTLAHWIAFGIPLALLAPLLGFLLHLDAKAYWLLSLTTLIGTLTLSFLGAIGAALTLGLKRGGLLLPLLILPFYIPVLIFGVGSVVVFITGPGSFVPPLLILCAITLGAIILSPLATAAALRMALQ